MEANLPLSGLVVVEIGHSVAAPYGGNILGQLGATVIKVEKLSGDDARTWGPPFWEGAAAAFQALNRDKLGITVDLKDTEQKARLRRLIVRHADVVLQNLRPGAVETFGLGAEIRREAPRLVYCNLAAFGTTGPMRDRPGYDPLMQAFGGIMSITGEEGREPVRVGPSIIDMASGMWAVIGILSALRRRDVTGTGCEVDTSLFETALAWMTLPAAFYSSSGFISGRTGSDAPMLCPYKAFKASDGYIVIAAGNDNLFRRLCDAVNRPEWGADERFRTNSDRVGHRDTLNAMLQELVEQDTTVGWIVRLEKAGVPCAPLQTIDQVLSNEQTLALGMMQQGPSQRLEIMGLPVSFDGQRPPFRKNPPRLGEHDQTIEEILAGSPGRVDSA